MKKNIIKKYDIEHFESDVFLHTKLIKALFVLKMSPRSELAFTYEKVGSKNFIQVHFPIVKIFKPEHSSI